LDIFIPHLNLAIEYDGVYFHSSKMMIKKDLKKNSVCKKNDITLIRIREKGLRKILSHDIEYNYQLKSSHKESFKDILLFIQNKFKLSQYELKLISEFDYDKFEIGPEILELYKEIEFNKSLKVINKKLSEEWNINKNNGLLPENVSANTRLLVWWKCKKCDNEWQATVHDRNRGWSNCKKCKSLEFNNPSLAKEWHIIKNNNITPFDVTYASEKKYWWICDKGHEYLTSVHTRNKGAGCPYCSGHKLYESNSLAKINPQLSKEWHPTLNENRTPEDVFSSSRTERAWWQCQINKEHVWETKIHSRHQLGQGCPYCNGKKVSKENSLSQNRPQLSKQWHPIKNNGLTPDTVTISSGKRVWWQCNSCNHEWQANINNRVRTSGKCPNCKKN
jgi:predicted Zn-ribbon and HTH transcriptional regulator